MFGPALVRYIIDPDNSLKIEEENRKAFIEKQMVKANMVDLKGIKNEFSFIQKFFTKMILVLNK